MHLLDRSVWVALLRARKPLDLESVVEFETVVTCLPVIQEVLQGIGDAGAFRIAEEAMLALPRVESPLREEIVREALGLYRAARGRGLTVRSSVDCLIAACAIRSDLTVLHIDRDYEQLSRGSPLRQRRIV